MFTFPRMSYRWYIFTLAVLSYVIITGVERMCMPVLFKEISTDLHLSIVSIGTVWGMDPLAGVFIGIPGGLLADRFGIKRTLVVVCILAGVFGALRGLSFNFTSLAGTMFLFGLMGTIIPSVAPKVTVLWFSGRYLSLTNALLTIAHSLGGMMGTMTAATVFSPLLGGWRNVLIAFGVPGVIVGLLWLTISNKSPRTVSTDAAVAPVPFKEGLFKVLRSRELWAIGLLTMSYWASNVGMNGYLPTYLREIGWTPASADGVLTVFIATSCIGAIPVVILADRLRSRKSFIALSIIIMTVVLALTPFVKGPVIFAMFGVAGLLRNGASALFYVMIYEIKGVGSTYGGTAIGMANAIGMLGACISPPLGNSFHAFGASAPFMFWAVISALALPGLLFIKEQARKKTAIPAVDS